MGVGAGVGGIGVAVGVGAGVGLGVGAGVGGMGVGTGVDVASGAAVGVGVGIGVGAGVAVATGVSVGYGVAVEAAVGTAVTVADTRGPPEVSISGAGVEAAAGSAEGIAACTVGSKCGAAVGTAVAVGACVGFSPAQPARSANDRTLIIKSRIVKFTARIVAESRSGPHFAHVLRRLSWAVATLDPGLTGAVEVPTISSGCRSYRQQLYATSWLAVVAAYDFTPLQGGI